jgi:predicted N-acetyltransferase YhbS
VPGSSRHLVAGRSGMGMTMITIRRELAKDAAAREALLDLGYGCSRFGKVSHRLREGRQPSPELAFVACDRGRIIGTVRLWDVATGEGRPALLLGPLTVHPEHRCRGVGGALVRRAIETAARLGHRAVLLVGDAAYYERFGFSSEKTRSLWLPGRYDAQRFLALELSPGALDGAGGLVGATGRSLPAHSEPVRTAPSLPQAA